MMMVDPYGEDSQFDLYTDFDRLYQQNRNSYLNMNPPYELHHYTNNAGLVGIVEKQGFYASPTFSLNDPKELHYGLEVIEQACLDLTFGQVASQMELRIAKAIIDNEMMKTKRYPSSMPTVILTSFSESYDNLSQWRSYSDDGNGFVVTINPQAIDFNSQAIKAFNGSWVFCKCIYNLETQKSYVIDYIKKVASYISSYENNFTDTIISNYTLISLWDLASSFKHEAYADEKEWRVRTSIGASDANLLLSYYQSGKTIKASKLLSIQDREVIKRITLGPKNIPESAALGVQVLLAHSGLKNKNVIQTLVSKAPYR